jgi:hypothetical protein
MPLARRGISYISSAEGLQGPALLNARKPLNQLDNIHWHADCGYPVDWRVQRRMHFQTDQGASQ